jgi:hypothetical protein
MLKTQNGLAINDQENYKYIAETLRKHGSFIVSWTDQNSVHYDILFVVRPAHSPEQLDSLAGGINPSYLFVSIMRLGAFAFTTGRQSGHNYYAEKLGIQNNASYALAEFVNGVRTLL